ncbi:MAG: hypothetical protein DRR06_06730 [Gammaproteobacteria bacterium]|nr:MAG: hypothetical protein DRR06_06730 [Gammaproteobacteria bacterium]RLA53662.1 MAG: hypothetical protein DRR42_04145 [Gammaproteobacteria bacterium]
MLEMIFAFIAMVLIISAMSVGVILAKKPIKGSCGGIAALGMDTSCDICGGDTSKCEDESLASPEQATLAYDATRK